MPFITMSTSSHTPEPWFICTTEPAEIRTHPYLGSTIGHTIPNAYNAHRIVAAVNAVAGMPDPAAEIQAMREAIREAHEALGGCMKYILKLPLSGSYFECEVMDDAHHALRKLKPFLP